MTQAEQEHEDLKIQGARAGFAGVNSIVEEMEHWNCALSRREDVATAMGIFMEKKLRREALAGLLACAIVLLADERRKNQLAE